MEQEAAMSTHALRASARSCATLPAMVRTWLLVGLTSLVLLLGASLAPAPARADRDTQLWLSAQLRLRFHKQVHLDIEQGLRLDEDISHAGRVLSEGVLAVRVTDWLRLSVGYRYTWVNDNSPDSRHRVHGDARFGDSVGHFTWVTRVRYQAGIRDGRPTRHTLRGLFGVGIRNDSPVTPYVSTEVFTDVGHGDGPVQRAWRGTAGVEIATKRHALDVYYRIEIPLNDDRDPTLHILGLSYGYEAKLY
jgi:hypothetical protein